MIGKIGAGSNRVVLGLALLAAAVILWLGRSSVPSPLSSKFSDWTGPLGMMYGTADAEPRFNTTWHGQIALEMKTRKNDLNSVATPSGVLDRTRVALLMEDRPLPYLIPLLLHFISVVPPEWSFRFMGSKQSIELMESNPTVRRYMDNKKLFLDLIPYHLVADIDSYATVNYLLTRPQLYEEWLWPAEWVFLFQDDSMICSASKLTVNDFVDEGWSFLGVSSYGREVPHSTGGGFSLRRVSHLVKQLKTYSYEQWAQDGNLASEDYYFSMALWDLPEAKQPTGPDAIRWGVVVGYHDDPDEMPLGFHPFSSDGLFRGVDGQKNQDKAYAYCPELAIISVGRWDCQCSPNRAKPGGLGG